MAAHKLLDLGFVDFSNYKDKCGGEVYYKILNETNKEILKWKLFPVGADIWHLRKYHIVKNESSEVLEKYTDSLDNLIEEIL